MKIYLIDLDGTLYRGDEPVEYAADFIDYLNHNGRKYLLTTNCPLHSPAEIVAKLKAMGITTAADKIITSALACRDYLLEHYPGKKVYVIGSRSFKELLAQSDIQLTNGYSDAVVIGYDQYLTYTHIKRACINILNGAAFISTNMDNAIPFRKTYIPHTGAITSAVQYAVNLKPVVIGKPNRHMFASALKMLDCKEEDCAVIGDRLDIDIQFAYNNHIPGYLVLTGVAKASDLRSSIVKPDKCFENLKNIIQMEGSNIDVL